MAETRFNAAIPSSLAVAKLGMYSGVLALGVGDAMASIAGRRYGKVKWPGRQSAIDSYPSVWFTTGRKCFNVCKLRIFVVCIIPKDFN